MKVTFINLNTNRTTTNGTLALEWIKRGFEVKTVKK